MRDLAQQTVIGNIITLVVDVKERVLEATLMGYIEKTVREVTKALYVQSTDGLDAIVKEVKGNVRTRRQRYTLTIFFVVRSE